MSWWPVTNRFTGWHLLVSWKDGTTSYAPLHEMKDAYPVQVAEYATASMISGEPAFKWWVPHVIKKRDRIISKITKGKGKYWTLAQKYGIELPKTVAKALEIDWHTRTMFWRDPIEKEMKNVSVAFKLNDDDSIPVGYKHVTCHMVFVINMIGLVWKACLVIGGHLTDPPVDSICSSVSIGVLQWIVALGQIDLIVPVSLLSCFMMSPCEGHLQQCYHIFLHLKQFNRSHLVFDDAVPDLSDKYFHVCNWSKYYPEAAEAVPPNMPEALGN